MTSTRRFLLTFSLVLAAATAVSAATPFRLFEVAVTRFTSLPNGRALLEYGQLGAGGRLKITDTNNVAMPPGMPDAALGKNLVSSEAWFAFQSLGSQALSNFERINGGIPHIIAGIPFYEVAAGAAPSWTWRAW